MTEKIDFTIAVNGARHAVSVPSDATLLRLLREDLLLTGAKRGCNQGVCGACTVWIDGAPVRACLTLAANVGEREVTTIEGIGEQGRLTALQEAFVNHGAMQCGFCTPGMVMSLEAFLRDNPAPDRSALRASLSGQLCRCTGYSKILDAAMAVVKDRK